MIVSGGGLSAAGDKWISCRPGFFLPVQVSSRLFRRLLIEGLAALHRAGKLNFFGELWRLADPVAFAKWLAPLHKINWVVYAKPPFGGPEAVLGNLSRYTHRVAISNGRLISADARTVTVGWKDCRIKQGKQRRSCAWLLTSLSGAFSSMSSQIASIGSGTTEDLPVRDEKPISPRSEPSIGGEAPFGEASEVEEIAPLTLREACADSSGQMRIIEAFCCARTRARQAAINSSTSARRVEALLYRMPGASKPAPGHKIYSYLLRKLALTWENKDWAMDFTYTPMRRSFAYLVAVGDGGKMSWVGTTRSVPAPSIPFQLMLIRN